METEPYPISKTLAEKAAWALAREHGVDLVTIHPVFVVGPAISKRTDATTVAMFIVRSPSPQILFSTESSYGPLSASELWLLRCCDLSLAIAWGL